MARQPAREGSCALHREVRRTDEWGRLARCITPVLLTSVAATAAVDGANGALLAAPNPDVAGAGKGTAVIS